MNKRAICFLVSLMAVFVSTAMLISACISLFTGHIHESKIFFYCGGGGLLVTGTLAKLLYSSQESDFKMGVRDGFAAVALSWITVSLLGALPFIFVVGLYPHDAFFETVSGFTTTGATLIDPNLILMNGKTLPNGIESLPRSILFWRAMTHWLGGMGIVTLMLAIIPQIQTSGKTMFNAESTGVKDSSRDGRIAPSISKSAMYLWIVYTGLTVLETIMLWAGGMPLFDAVCHSMSTIATGGFSTKQDSIAFYHSAYIDWVITFFMFLAGCNFLLHYRFLTGHFSAFWKNEEFRFYLLTVLIFSGIIMATLIANQTKYYSDIPLALRDSVFQVVSIMTSTGFTTTDYGFWPAGATIPLFILMCFGGCGGSTAGGMKCIRIIVILKEGLMELKRCIFPRMIPSIRINGVRIESTTMQKTIGFCFCFFCLYILFAMLVPLTCPGMELGTSMTASLACLSNIGPAFFQIGPMVTYSWLTPQAKILYAVEMILGRLELYTLLVLLLPSFWKK